MGASIGTIGSVIGIASGVNSLSGGTAFGGGPTQISSGQADPWGTSGGRQQAGGMLQQLMTNPAQALSAPGFAASRQDQLATLTAQQAATGNVQSGKAVEQDAQLINQMTMSNYSQYEGILANLAGVGNASQGVQAGMVNQYGQNSGWQGVAQGVGALSASLGQGDPNAASNNQSQVLSAYTPSGGFGTATGSGLDT